VIARIRVSSCAVDAGAEDMLPSHAIRASCGALLLAGEYTVLAPGGQGIALPWPRHVRLSWQSPGSDEVRVRAVDGEQVADARGLRRMLMEEGRSVPSFTLTLDFGERPARSSSAMVAAFLGQHLAVNPAHVLRTALQLHSAMQGGRGSGVDVAMAFQARPMLFRNGDAGDLPQVAPLVIPAGLRLLAAASPKGLPTAEAVARFQRNARSLPEVAENFRVAQQSAVEPIARLLRAGDAAGLLTAWRRLVPAWLLLDRLLEGDFLGDKAEAIAGEAHDLGAGVHPSGACADTWVAVHPDGARLEELEKRWRRRGLHTEIIQAGAGGEPAESA
jgi:mevalonate kinase